MILFCQLFDASSSTFTYLLADLQSREAIIIDPVREQLERDLASLAEYGLNLVFILETHVHADHVTGAQALRERTGAKTVISQLCAVQCADRTIQDGDSIIFGKQLIRIMATPGHTPGSVSYHWHDRLFTGDTLLIGGCGRTDLQRGDAGTLYDSVTQKIFALPGETLIYPGHDYNGRCVSCVAQEKQSNPRFLGKTRDEFIQLMGNLNLPAPERMEDTIPANLRCGRL